MNVPSSNELTFPDPWEEFYDKQNQSTAFECGNDDSGGGDDNTNEHCDLSETMIGAGDHTDGSYNQNVDTAHSSDNFNRNEIGSNNNDNNDNASNDAHESHAQYYHHHDSCTDYHIENQQQQQEHQPHHQHHHHEHDDNYTLHETNAHTNESISLEHENQSDNSNKIDNVSEPSDTNDDQVRKNSLQTPSQPCLCVYTVQ